MNFVIYLIFILILFYQHSSLAETEPEDTNDTDPDVVEVDIVRETKYKRRCPRILNIAYGFAKIRHKGRTASFKCQVGFSIYGKNIVQCLLGKWKNAPPICVSHNCRDIDSPVNGLVQSSFNGVLTFECNPGYKLEGEKILICQNYRWNGSAPLCLAPVVSVASKCDFEEENICGWTHDINHDFEWHRHNFGTPSGHVGTGPSHDHTHGEGGSGFYMYIEASSPRKENDTARLYSPVYSWQLSLTACFEFWYHMYGATSGFLRVYVKPESVPFTRLTPSFELQGDQGNDWKIGQVKIPRTSENFQIIIEGVRGPSYVSDTAVDDVYLQPFDCPTSTLPATGSYATVKPTFENDTDTRNKSDIVTNTVPITTASTEKEVTNGYSSTIPLTPKITTGSSVISSTLPLFTLSSTISTPKMTYSTVLMPKILSIQSTEPTVFTKSTSSSLKPFTTPSSIFISTVKSKSISKLETTTIEVVPSTNSSSIFNISSAHSSSLPSTVFSNIKSTVLSNVKSTLLSNVKPTVSTKSTRNTTLKYTSFSTSSQSSVFEEDNQPLPPNARRGAKETPVIPIAIGASIGIISIVVIVIVGYHIIKRRKVVQGKLDEDSELRYLANDVEYADPINVPEPQIA